MLSVQLITQYSLQVGGGEQTIAQVSLLPVLCSFTASHHIVILLTSFYDSFFLCALLFLLFLSLLFSLSLSVSFPPPGVHILTT